MESLKIDPSKYKFSPKEFKSSITPDGTTYTHRFPVVKYKNRTTVLECELTIDADSGQVNINVSDINREPYPPFYHIYCGNYSPILDKIHKAINTELIRLELIKNDAA